MQWAAMSKISTRSSVEWEFQGLECGGGIEGHQTAMQLFPGGGDGLHMIIWIQ